MISGENMVSSVKVGETGFSASTVACSFILIFDLKSAACCITYIYCIGERGSSFFCQVGQTGLSQVGRAVNGCVQVY